MQAVAAQNARVRDPVYHVVLSWPEGESPTDDQAFACGAHVRACVGMAGHQFVMAIHRDTSHVHAHVAVNRIDPHSYKSVYPDRDYFKLDRAMRELELRFGWQHDRGPYAVFERNGVMVIDWSSKAPATKERIPTAAADMERHTNQESFFSYLRADPRAALVSALRREDLTWQSLHQLLTKHGVSIRPAGQGLAVYDAIAGATAGQKCIRIKASDMHEELSKARLERRLGPYQPAAEIGLAEESYDPFRAPRRDPTKREERRQKRADARRELRERYRQYVKELVPLRLDPALARFRLEALRAGTRQRRAAARTEPDRARRKAMLSIIAFEAARDRQRLLEEMRRERAELRAQNARARQSYREWVGHRAADGDLAAIHQLRGWDYAATRSRRAPAAARPSHFNGFRFDGMGADSVGVVSTAFPWSVRRDGSIRYLVNTDACVTDRGDVIEVTARSSMIDAVRLALSVATEKFGGRIIVEGSKTFRDLVEAIRAASEGDAPHVQALADAMLDHSQAANPPRGTGLKPDRT